MGVKMKVCPWCGNEMEEYVSKCSKCGEDMSAQGDETGSMYGANDMAYNGYGGSGNGMYDNGYAGNSGGYGDYQAPYPAYRMPDGSRTPARRKGGGGLVLAAAVFFIVLIGFALSKYNVSNAKKEYGPIVQKIMAVDWNEGIAGVYSKYGFIDYTKSSMIIGDYEPPDPAFTYKIEVKRAKKLFGIQKKKCIEQAKAQASSVGAGSYFDEESIREVVRVDVQRNSFLFSKPSFIEEFQLYLVKVKGNNSWKLLDWKNGKFVRAY